MIYSVSEAFLSSNYLHEFCLSSSNIHILGVLVLVYADAYM